MSSGPTVTVTAAVTAVARRPQLVWGVGVLAYVVAVFHRSSLGVAGVAAGERFGVGTAVLALFSVAQLAVYALMQIPVGVLLDRFGSRRLLATGAALMIGGQVAFALGTDVRTAIAARVLIGIGDAMTFISVLRLVAAWFPPRRNALYVQLTGMLGQVGSLASAVPLVLLLDAAGWRTSFLASAGFGVVALVLVTTALRDAPRPAPAGPSGVVAGLGAAWAQPGTRLGLWTHFVTQFSGTVFALLWGYPFLTQGQGLPPATAALLLSTLTVAGIAVGPLVGQFCGRLPYHRSTLVLAITAGSGLAWGVVLLWPGRAPLWLLVALVLVLAGNGPGSMIGFDYARTFNPASRLGGATGIVNVGGFGASILLIVGIGTVLDVLTPAGAAHPSLAAYRWAFALQYVLWVVGAVQVLRYRRAARRDLAVRHPAKLAAIRAGTPVLVH
jgi:MFS family permease